MHSNISGLKIMQSGIWSPDLKHNYLLHANKIFSQNKSDLTEIEES